MNNRKTLLLATRNAGKIRELSDILAGLPFTVNTLDQYPTTREVDETGTTFRENAELKAVSVAKQTGALSLADDSGLEVDALGGEPGVYSARFAGETSGYDVKMSRLLEMLDATGDPERRARFICVMSLADGGGRVLHSVEGICRGSIIHGPRGTGGFGYDPIFVPDGYDKTFAELDMPTKTEIGHRGKAARLMMRYLLDFIAV